MSNSDHDHLNLTEVRVRNENAFSIIRGFSRNFPALADVWQALNSALVDEATLILEITGLRAEVMNMRLHRANLIAAGLATLHAFRDGEDDALFYLRDELDSQQSGGGA